MQDVEFHGCKITKGDRVLLPWASGNRDADFFQEPDRLDIERSPNRHMIFGVGIHRCAGSHFARMMAKTTISSVLSRLPDLRVDIAGCKPYSHQGVNSGWRTIPAIFTPGARLNPSHPGRP